jgi:hypothetical protein
MRGFDLPQIAPSRLRQPYWIGFDIRRPIKRFRAKWVPVRVKKTRQNKNLEPGFDSIKIE